VRIGDGCATVTGYKLPKPLVPPGPGRRERGQAPSQDIGLVVLVEVPEFGTDFSVKRRMRPANSACAGWIRLDAFILRFAGV
jgi:hypothetical protein